tara:strand:- start:16888 stop:17409 length:522 start_codon:yes stop_codon:yes gene_type:complete
MRELLVLARESIKETIERTTCINLEPYKQKYQKKQSVFITLKKDNQLRGCIGQLISEKPLWKNVYDLAKKAAFSDYRFLSIQKEELGDIVIEISLLSALQPINSLEEIVIGKHGVQLVIQEKTAVFLPQVAINQQWTRQELVEQLSEKAGLEKNAWKRGSLNIFTTTIIQEEK